MRKTNSWPGQWIACECSQSWLRQGGKILLKILLKSAFFLTHDKTAKVWGAKLEPLTVNQIWLLIWTVSFIRFDKCKDFDDLVVENIVIRVIISYYNDI